MFKNVFNVSSFCSFLCWFCLSSLFFDVLANVSSSWLLGKVFFSFFQRLVKQLVMHPGCFLQCSSEKRNVLFFVFSGKKLLAHF